MKRTQPTSLAILATVLSMPGVLAQFDAGSDGSDGALNILANTTTVAPPDGIFNFTTVTIASGARWVILPNANGTPVYVLSQGDVVINGYLDVNGQRGDAVSGGRAGAGGFPGGNPGSAGTPPGDGQGPGGGKGGAGSTSADGAGAGGHASAGSGGNSTKHGGSYGSALLMPPEGGASGGGTTGTPGDGGGGGGGAITIASNTRIALDQNARVEAIGGTSSGGAYNGGAGGSIRLVAPKVEGSGQLYSYGQGGGGHGRNRVDTTDRTNLALRYNRGEYTTIGSMMVVRPDPFPRLDVIQAAGTDIPLGSGPVQVLLPFGADPNVSVMVQATDFNAVVPIRLVLTPDNGPGTSYDAEIDNASDNPATTTVNVTLPINTQTTIRVWTR
ncbi:MAG: hypothetical protein H7A46_04900 [Verrucomicrobiales bacterium]|nr:hypothetical protein [Verrucomicrobiales bacterium]